MVSLPSVLWVLQLVLFISCKSSSPILGNEQNRIYFISPNGSDDNDGSFETPFKTINKGLLLAEPGETVMVREGIYREKVVFGKSGIKDKYITLKAYSGEKAVISGEGLPVNGGEGLVGIHNVRWIVLEGFDICDFKTLAPWTNPDGILVNEGADHIIIRNNRVYNIENNCKPEDGRSAHAIQIIGNTSDAVTDILIEENEIFDCNTGYSENLTINGYVDGFTIRKNKVYNGENIGIDAAGGYGANPNPSLNYARNGLISENEVFDIDGRKGPIPAYSEHNGAIGIYVDGARNITVERNKVYRVGRGIGIVSETDNFPTEHCHVRNNLVYHCSLVGIYMGGYVGYTGGGTNHCTVVNNTLFHNSMELGYSNDVEGEIRLTENCHNNRIANNIIYPRPDRGLFINKLTENGADNFFDANLYFSTGISRWVWDGKELLEFDDWQRACGGDRSSIYGVDPEFKSLTIPGLHIQSTSPAFQMGIVEESYSSGPLDIDGESRTKDNKISIGADECH